MLLYTKHSAFPEAISDVLSQRLNRKDGNSGNQTVSYISA
jgi:hypothetical protein